MDDPPPRRLGAARGLHHVHDDERIDLGSTGKAHYVSPRGRHTRSFHWQKQARSMQAVRIFAALLVLLVTLAAPARALTLLRDPDIEHGLKVLAGPVLRAAGLSPERVDILVIDAPSLNAFVVDANTIFLHSGLILRMKTPAMLQSVIAHEAAHIANGHLMRRPLNLRNARNAAALGTILAGIAGIGRAHV